jgi:hypothetical protein
MTKIALIPVLLLLLSACGAPFTADELGNGIGQAGAAAASAGSASASEAGTAPFAGAPSTANAGEGGTSAGGSSGVVVPVAGAAGATTSEGGAGGASVLDPICAKAADTTSPGYLDVPASSTICYRFSASEVFDTVTCGGGIFSSNPGTDDAVFINGQPIVCGQKQSFAPAIGGYNYLEMRHPMRTSEGTSAGWVRWFELQPTVPCMNPVEVGGQPVPLNAPEACLKTRSFFKSATGAGSRTLTIDGFKEPPGETEVGYPPTTDPEGYIYIVVGPGPAVYLRLQ